jgi:2-polyprenyl-3-methyl-5-hydroxy-6-metoxy-1,4-benzoquinol methylase
MNADRFSDEQIIKSWEKNALPWTVAVRAGQIESRKQITDRAIVDAILNCTPSSVLDLGCGEGWLVRELTAKNITTIGTDAVPMQIEAAQSFGNGDFRVISYEDITAGQLKVSVDVVSCNFSLLGKESVEGIFSAVPSLLNACGSFRFVVRTLVLLPRTEVLTTNGDTVVPRSCEAFESTSQTCNLL